MPDSTAACESLPSQIENFTKQFFGELVKTEIDGSVQWVLPCDLDIGLVNNSRAAGEGLACYFLRLFRDGIIGLTGPAGTTGTPGVDGANAFTVTIQPFTQPTLGAPNIQVKSVFNPAIIADLNIFIQGSGWYQVDTVDATGTLYLTLTRALSGISGLIPAGRLIVPAGYPGNSITGPIGPQGPIGATGPSGAAVTSSNGMYYASVGTDYSLLATFNNVNFINSAPQLLLPALGTYLLSVVVSVKGAAGIALNDVVSAKLYNSSIGGDVSGSAQKISNLVLNQQTQIILNAIHSTAGTNQTVTLLANCTTAAAAKIVALNTTMSYVRIG